MKIVLWKDGEFTDLANNMMFVFSFILAVVGFIYSAIKLSGH